MERKKKWETSKFRLIPNRQYFVEKNIENLTFFGSLRSRLVVESKRETRNARVTG